jgi:DUF4097 and DUF4098 domain-containing protein YvlB
MNRYSAFALVLLAVSPISAAEKSFDRTFAASAGGALVVEADGASVRVSGGDTNQVVVHMTARGSDEDLANMKLDAIQKDNEVTVTMRRQGKASGFWNRSWNSDGEIEVIVPKHFGISVKTAGGSVKLTDTVGTAKLHTSGGEIVAKNVNGNIEARTSGGGIYTDTIRGDVDANTSGGDLRLLQVDGKIRGRTSGGSVHCSLVGANRGISASTSGGSIRLTLPRNTTANLEATTSGGEFTSDIPVATTVNRDGLVRGSINGGGLPIDVSTSGGGISVRSN